MITSTTMSVVVEVSAHQFSVPRQCACCGATAQTELAASYTRTTGKRVVRHHTRSLMFPYCEGCKAHIKLWNSAISFGRAFSISGFVLGILAALCGGGISSFFVCWGIGVVLALVMFILRRSTAKARSGANCAAASAAVAHLGWSGSVSSFEFTSGYYGASFATANATKLVNVSMALQRLLETRATALQRGVAEAPHLRLPPETSVTAPRRQRETEPRVDSQTALGNAVLDWISRIESYKGPEARRNALIRALQEISDPAAQRQLRLAVSRIETAAVLEKVDGLSTAAAKRRHLEKAIAALRSDDIPDELQAEGLRELEARLRELG